MIVHVSVILRRTALMALTAVSTKSEVSCLSLEDGIIPLVLYLSLVQLFKAPFS